MNSVYKNIKNCKEFSLKSKNDGEHLKLETFFSQKQDWLCNIYFCKDKYYLQVQRV